MLLGLIFSIFEEQKLDAVKTDVSVLYTVILPENFFFYIEKLHQPLLQ